MMFGLFGGERAARKRALAGATVLSFDCRGCMASDNSSGAQIEAREGVDLHVGEQVRGQSAAHRNALQLSPLAKVPDGQAAPLIFGKA
jgi:hypothetical protein